MFGIQCHHHLFFSFGIQSHCTHPFRYFESPLSFCVLTLRVVSLQSYLSESQFWPSCSLALHILPSQVCIYPYFSHLVTLCLSFIRHCFSRFPFSLPMTKSFEFTTHTSVMLLGTLHLAFSCGSHMIVSFRHIRSYTPKWFDHYSSVIWFSKSLLETSQRESRSLVWLQRHFEISFSFRIRAFVFIPWFGRVRVLLVHLQGSFFFFGRVYSIPLTIHTFFSLQCSYFLRS